MKILGWMHRKFRGNEPLRDFSIGNPCSCLSRQASLDDLKYYPNPNSAPKPLGKPLRELNLRNSFAGLKSKGFEEDDFEDDLSAANSELFHGFLTIGTFGSGPLVADPTATPTFSISVENIAEKETEVTEYDLKLINNELEKVLGNEEEESPGRKSHVSTRRSSHASTITLSGNLFDGTDANGNGTLTCPLQGYLFGSAIDLTETTRVRKERASLGELFQKTNIEEEKCNDKTDRGEKRKDKGNDHKSAIHIIMKSMLKKKTGQASSQNSSPATEKNVDSASTNTKLQKILRIFHRKVYPEGSMTSRKSDKPPKNEMKNKTKHEKRCINGDHIFTDDDNIIYPQKGQKCFNLSQATVSATDFNGNKECWIKTDSDYLVLEL